VINDTVLADVRHVAARISRLLNTPVYSRDDVRQDLLLRILERAPKHDSGRASARTWAALVVRHGAADIIGQALAQKRDCRVCTKSLDEKIETGDGTGTVERSATVSADAYSMRLARQSRPAEELLDLQIDVKCALAGVRPDVAFFARRLAYESVGEAARAAGFSRATAHRRIQDLRSVFTLHGLDRYVFGVRKGPRAHPRGR
jgi:DNA-directed RNA polymerase specialized sigma24 family protein